jgi:hypothetical protein
MILNPNRYLILTSCLAWLAGCGVWKTDTEALTSRSTAMAEGPDCASCHGYPLKDFNHEYHLFKAGGSRDLNGEITCLECHSQSIQYKDVTLVDSVYEDPIGQQWMTLEFPNPGDKTDSGDVIRNLPLLRVDTLYRHVPTAQPARPGPKPLFREFVTALAHMNGQVDVRFDAKSSRPGKFNGDSASYNPTQETCSAVACHPGPKVYSWGSVAKGLPELKDGP